MLKEIHEQPQAVRNTTLGRFCPKTRRVSLENWSFTDEDFRRFQEVKIVACGTSWHAGLVGKFLLERLARIPVEVDFGSEFRYRGPLLGPPTLTVVITQSGETADTLGAQREAKQKGSKTLAICNVVGSMATREAEGTVYTRAGPEIGVASTKAFTAQIAVLFLLALYIGQVRRQIPGPESVRLIEKLAQLPAKLEALLAHSSATAKLAKLFYKSRNFLFLGRGIHYPIALEGALKLGSSPKSVTTYPRGEGAARNCDRWPRRS